MWKCRYCFKEFVDKRCRPINMYNVSPSLGNERAGMCKELYTWWEEIRTCLLSSVFWGGGGGGGVTEWQCYFLAGQFIYMGWPVLVEISNQCASYQQPEMLTLTTELHLILVGLHICSANEGPVRIHYKCLVRINVFLELKLSGPRHFKNIIIMFCRPISTFMYLWFLYSQARSAEDWSWEYINCSQNVESGNKARQFHSGNICF